MELKIMKFTCCIFLFIAVFNICHCSYSNRVEDWKRSLHIRYEHQLKGKEGFSNDFTQNIDTTLFDNIEATNCSTNDQKYCRKWGNQGLLRISKIDRNCEQYQFWTTLDKPLQVTFDLKQIHLYGGREEASQTWPIKDTSGRYIPFVSSEFSNTAILEPLWFTSSGFYLQVEEKVPLFVAYEKNSLNLRAKRELPYIRGKVTRMDYKVCKYDNIKTAFKRAIADSIGKPVAPPDYDTVERPIWSTWAKFLTGINEKSVTEYANSIIKNRFPYSRLGIDDKWETCYGSYTVDAKRFPNMTSMVEKLHSMGFRVTLWIHPFVNVECTDHYNEGVKKDFFVKKLDGAGSGIAHWWRGQAGLIDYTNPEATEWYKMRLQSVLDQTGVDSFKFVCGESSRPPQPPVYYGMREDHPETILKTYIAAAASFGGMVEARGARHTQQNKIFVRMNDRKNRWSGELGLNTVIPALLFLNLIGFPYIIPDMIGGNGFDSMKITKEMYIRWMQLQVFMPVMQFSIPPWDHDEEVSNISRKYVELHRKHAPMIYDLMTRATREETMVNAPLWWIDPTDQTALSIDSEFLVGDILVAPVVEQGATSRDIYFPKGTWRDETNSAPYIIGPTWVNNYPAPLDVLPYFTKIQLPYYCETCV